MPFLSTDYDRIFESTPHYQGPPEESPYYPLWQTALVSMTGYRRVLDAGCGPGQFGELCVKAGHEYVGVDYSAKAVELAEKRGYGEYHQVDLEVDRSLISAGGYDVFTAFEFFEHVGDDVGILSAVPAGKPVIFSVPDYLTEEHTRCFKSLAEVRSYYPVVAEVGWVLSGENPQMGAVNIYMIKGIRSF